MVKKIRRRIRWWWLCRIDKRKQIERRAMQRKAVKDFVGPPPIKVHPKQHVEESLSKEEMGRRELVTLAMMAERWQKADLAGADCDGTEKFIYTDYIEKLSQWMMPYVGRLKDTNAITYEEFDEFCQELAVLTDELREKLQLPGPDIA